MRANPPASDRPRAAALTAAAGVLVAGAGAFVAAHRRWSTNPDPTGGDPLGLPDVREERVVTGDGTSLWLGVTGPPEATSTIVLSHCWTGDHRIWAPVARVLATEHRVVLYDQRGHGRSTIGRTGLTVDALADDLRTVIEHVDARNSLVAGHSMGGMAAQAFAIAHPDVASARVASLVLVATACGQVERSPFMTFVPRWSITNETVARALGGRRAGPVLMRGTVGRRPVLAHLDAVVETFLATPASTRGTLLDAMVAMDLRDGLRDVDLPVVVVSGTRDLLTSPAQSRQIVDLLPAGRLEVIAGAGHMLPFEAPHELTRIIRAALVAPAARV